MLLQSELLLATHEAIRSHEAALHKNIGQHQKQVLYQKTSKSCGKLTDHFRLIEVPHKLLGLKRGEQLESRICFVQGWMEVKFSLTADSSAPFQKQQLKWRPPNQ